MEILGNKKRFIRPYHQLSFFGCAYYIYNVGTHKQTLFCLLCFGLTCPSMQSIVLKKSKPKKRVLSTEKRSF